MSAANASKSAWQIAQRSEKRQGRLLRCGRNLFSARRSFFNGKASHLVTPGVSALECFENQSRIVHRYVSTSSGKITRTGGASRPSLRQSVSVLSDKTVAMSMMAHDSSLFDDQWQRCAPVAGNLLFDERSLCRAIVEQVHAGKIIETKTLAATPVRGSI